MTAGLASGSGDDAAATRMAHEIAQAPAVVATFLEAARSEVAAAAAAVRSRRPRWVSFVGRGTSDHAATYGRYLVETHLGLPCGLAAPSVTTLYRAPLDWQDVLLVAVSQSGRSPDVVEVVADARARGALTLVVVNDPRSPLAATAHHVLDCRAGLERAVAATKTYVAELVACAALIAALRPRSELARALPALPDVLAATLDAAGAWLGAGDLPAALAAADRALVVSRGFNLATALETALKLKETTGIFADGYSTADLEHGPVALAGPHVPVIAFRPDGDAGARIDGALARAAAVGASVWVIGGREAESPSARRGRAGSFALRLGLGLPEALTPPALILPGQLLAETAARTRGRDPDAPAGLSKVTLTH